VNSKVQLHSLELGEKLGLDAFGPKSSLLCIALALSIRTFWGAEYRTFSFAMVSKIPFIQFLCFSGDWFRFLLFLGWVKVFGGTVYAPSLLDYLA
jgi:hypothetical protein